ncbi:MAG: oxaloacetate decarboxylase [Saprospiraceae bacterium]|nr:oxaloacetate decarboxylase [Saprospiraceae bacterium]
MESTLSNATLLMFIGMITVFFILFIVVSGTNVLIRLVNKVELNSQEVPFAKFETDSIQPDIIAAIHASVDVITKGKGKVDNIEHL